VIVVGPSNPIVSIGPILAVPGLLSEIADARRRGVPAVGVSGIVGGKALRGPADRMMAGLGEAPNALGVARRYAEAGLLDVFVIDVADEALADEMERDGCPDADAIASPNGRHCIDHFLEQPHAVDDSAAVVVCPVVGAILKELVEQVAVGAMHFNAIEAGCLGIPGREFVFGNHTGNF